MDKNEILFRCVAVALLVSFIAVRNYYRRRVESEPVATGRAQARDKLCYQSISVSYMLTFVYALTHWLDFAHVSLPAWIRWIGALTAFAGIAILWWTHRTLGRNWSGILELRENHRLISEGPYRYIRHPMYTALLILSVGMALITANLLLALLLIGTTMAMYLARVSDEEAMMIERFGDEYHSYMRRTGRLFPRLRAE